MILNDKKTICIDKRNITNQNFFSVNNNLPSIINKDKKLITLDHSINRLTITNLETNESEINSNTNS